MSTPAEEVLSEAPVVADAAAEGETENELVNQPEGSDGGTVEFKGEEINFLDLPDDEVESFFQEQVELSADSAEDEGETASDDEATDDSADDTSTDTTDESDESDAEAEPEAEETAEEDEVEDLEASDEAEGEEDSSDDAEADDDEVVINALQDLEKILSPFQANGKQVQVENVDDAITLMQMGANYNKKMAALKPNLKFVKMLEQNDLLDESKLTTLIDITKGNPEAIGKFLKDNKIDPEEVTRHEAGDNYSPGDYKVNDSEVELDTVIDSIRGNESFPKTIDVVSNQWDQKSKEIIFNDPNIIAVIDSHIQSGVFDKISQRMETEKMLGKLNGVSDIAAYKQIGDVLSAAGLLNQTGVTTPAPDDKKADPVKPAKVVDKERNAKRKAAAATKQTVSKKKPSLDNLNPLSMSDEDFEKATENILI